MSNLYDELPWFLRSYVNEKGWTTFREIQTRTFEVLRDTEDNVLITAGTSGGKTEAAFLPVITSVHRDRPRGIGVLYISPLKALIDDQNDRLSRMLKDSGIPVTCWHGDVSASIKERMRNQPEGILQITPESLQGIIIRHFTDLDGMFFDLRYIVIDEIHSFMNSNRGLQLLCVIESIRLRTKCNPRIIGLSATVSDVGKACDWISSCSDRKTTAVVGGGVTDHTLSLRYFHIPDKDDPLRKAGILEYYETLQDETLPYNCLIFANSRLKAEKTAKALRTLNDNNISVHHGSISAEYRKIGEGRLKSHDEKARVISTMTMELGIDVGELDRVVQLDPPNSSSSFVQRMGRSGRRNGRPVMAIFCMDDDARPESCPMGMSMSLIQSLALVQLFEDERWIEPFRQSRLPYGLLFQQILVRIATVKRYGPKSLAADMRKMLPFSQIPEEDVKELIDHMINTGMITVLGESGILVPGPKGERVIAKHNFLATFDDDNRYEVRFGDKVIGYLPKCPVPGALILLGGYSWEVMAVQDGIVNVLMVKKEAETKWGSGLPDIDTKVIRAMRDVLASDRVYSRIDDAADRRLAQDRATMATAVSRTFVDNGDGTVTIHPWLGTVHFDTLVSVLKKVPKAKVASLVPHFSITVRTGLGEASLRQEIERIRTSVDPVELYDPETDDISLEKFDRYVPEDLLIRKFVSDRIDLGFDLL